ncbi:MAG: hypothetical protein ACRD4Q_10990 [Candidatus Acidiferrales bacterium]
MEEPRSLRLAHEIVRLVRQADVSRAEEHQALQAAKVTLDCYQDRAPYPEEWSASDLYHRAETQPV